MYKLCTFKNSDVYLWNHLVLWVSAAILDRLLAWVTTSLTLGRPAVTAGEES